MWRLNLGSGSARLKDFVNVDRDAACLPDVLADLESTPWPFGDACASEIRMTHVLEHLGQTTKAFLAIIVEIDRILITGSELHITVPHPRSDAFIGDPTHVRPITPWIMDLFSRENCLKWQHDGRANTPLALQLGVDLRVVETRYVLNKVWADRHDRGEISPDDLNFAVNTYFNVVDEIRLKMVKV